MSRTYLEELAGERFFSLKTSWQHGVALQSCVWTNHTTSRPKWRCFAIMNSATFGDNQTQHISANTSHHLSTTVVEVWWFGAFFAATRIWVPCIYRVSHELLCRPKYVICWPVNRSHVTGPNWILTTEQWSQAQHQIYNRTAKGETNQDVAMIQSSTIRNLCINKCLQTV